MQQQPRRSHETQKAKSQKAGETTYSTRTCTGPIVPHRTPSGNPGQCDGRTNHHQAETGPHCYPGGTCGGRSLPLNLVEQTSAVGMAEQIAATSGSKSKLG